MKIVLLLFLTLNLFAQPFYYIKLETAKKLNVFFLPQQKDEYITMLVEDLSLQENTVIYVSMYSFTYAPLRDAIINAKQRNCSIFVIVDPTQAGSTTLDEELEQNGILVKRKRTNSSALMHDKFVLIENGNIVWTGSANWTSSALTQDNNVIRMQYFDEIYEVYKNKFLTLWNK